MDRKTKKDPTVWRAKVLVLYRTVLQLKAENKQLSKQVKRLERKIKSIETWQKRKDSIIKWVKKIFCFKSR